MKFKNSYNDLNLIVPDIILAKIAEKGNSFYPNEIGGFLIGYYSSDLKTLHITDFLLPKKYKNNSYLFERSIDGIVSVFKRIFHKMKHYYVGEWHTHPNGSTMYSTTDLNAMINIAKNDNVVIENPILLILSIDKDKSYEFSFYLYTNEKLIKYDKN